MVRFKNRYLVVEVLTSSDLDPSSSSQSGISSSSAPSRPHNPAHKRPLELSEGLLANTVRTSLQINFGDVITSAVVPSLVVKYLSPQTKVAIIRAPFDHFRAVWASVTLISQLGQDHCAFRVLHIGGTIRSCQRFILDYNHQLIGKWQANLADQKNLKEIEQRLEIEREKLMQLT